MATLTVTYRDEKEKTLKGALSKLCPVGVAIRASGVHDKKAVARVLLIDDETRPPVMDCRPEAVQSDPISDDA